MVDPGAADYNPYPESNSYTADTWPEDQSYLSGIIPLPGSSSNGMYIADANNAKRGPFDNAVGRHQMFTSPFHTRSEHCGTCHDVSNPVFTRSSASTALYLPNEMGKRFESADLRLMFPIERTFSEWKASGYATGNNGVKVTTCQDCHMHNVTGKGAKMKDAPLRDNLPLHDMTGGNTFVPNLVKQQYPSEVDADALDAGIIRATNTLKSAATIEITLNNNLSPTEAIVKVTNNTGHKLPSGYPEGRRIWINVKFYDTNGNLIAGTESGAYNSNTGELANNAKVYCSEPGISSDLANALGKPDLAGPSFHMALNDMVYFDNRIPPAGFTNDALIEYQSPVVDQNGDINRTMYPDGQNWDMTSYSIPSGAASVVAKLYYQSASKEFIEFLANENYSNTRGSEILALWQNNGKSTPVLMCQDEEILPVSAPPVADFSATPTSGTTPLTVNFTDLSTNAPTSWSWEFGDGSVSATQNPSHTYSSAGTYSISLTVTNNFGNNTVTKANKITVSDAPILVPLTVNNVTFNPQSAKGGRSYVLAEVTLNEPVDGAVVTALFSGGKDATVSGTTTNGIVILESPAIKGSASWCLDITSIEKTGYTFDGPQQFCQLKSAFIHANSTDNYFNVYPNPFSDRLNFEFIAPEDNTATIVIYDNLGRNISTVFNSAITKGVTYRAEFVPEDNSGNMYFYRFTLGDQVTTGKAVLKK